MSQLESPVYHGYWAKKDAVSKAQRSTDLTGFWETNRRLSPTNKSLYPTEKLDIDAKLLSSGHVFPSDSNFRLQDFLRLRIVYKRSNAARLFPNKHATQLFTVQLDIDPVRKMTEVFEKSQDIQALRQLLSTSRKITKWTSASTDNFTRWDTAQPE